MREHPLDQIPFYAAGMLSDGSRAALEQHLSVCPACRSELANWEHIAVGMISLTSEQTLPLPPLSPIVRTSLRPHPTAVQVLRFAAHLIWMQRMVIFRSGIFPALALVILMVSLSGLLFPQGEVLFPLLALIPILGVLITAMLSGAQSDPAYELVATTPTRPGALIYARLSLALATIICMASAGSFFLSAITLQPLLRTISVWLFPLLLLTSLTTVLSQLWSPLPATAIALGGWWGTMFLLTRRSTLYPGDPSLGDLLAPLLDPSSQLVILELILALVFWAAGWILFSYSSYRSVYQENGQ
jgi:anti-sigma factor RsiW